MASESSPLLAYRLLGEEGAAFPPNGAGGSGVASARKLSTFLGVVVPTVLSMFSIVVFLRIGFVVGHAGLLQALAMLLVAYIILALTVLSVCAIATNGAGSGWEGATVSYLKTGQMFMNDVTGPSGIRVLPQGYGWNLLYGSLLLGLVGGVCTLGAGLYARASFLTFLLVSGSLASVLVSFVAVRPRDIQLAPRPGTNGSSAPPRTLLQEDYGFFRGISLWPPLVLIGIYATALSASMSSLIGASRILHALAQDDLFGVILAPAKVVSGGGNPWGAVLYSWGLVQVRKYLLRLDVRKEHVKFWRPQLLLLVGNPRGALPLLRLANQLKKGGLYVLGHVTLGDLGGMKPNTLVLGFYDDAPPQDHFLTDPAFSEPAEGTREGGSPALSTLFPPPRAPGSPRALSPQDYVATVADALKMNKNVVLARACGALPPERLSRGSGSSAQLHHVDVWPLNLLRPRGGPGYVDVCGLFLLQMATILSMVPAWHSARLRIFLCLGPREAPGAAEGRLRALLSQLRIRAEVQEVVWGEGAETGEPEEEEGDFVNGGRGDEEAEALACSANALVRAQQGRGTGGGPGGPEGRDGEEGPTTALTFLYLPRPPADPARYPRYLALLEILSRDLGPTLLVHGVTPAFEAPPPHAYRAGSLKPSGGAVPTPMLPASPYGGPTPASYATASTPAGPAFPVQVKVAQPAVVKSGGLAIGATVSQDQGLRRMLLGYMALLQEEEEEAGMGPSQPPEEELERLTKKLVHDMSHPPSGEYFGRCGGCGEDVVGDGAGVVALDRVFHIGCFVCSTCRAQLRGQHFYAVERRAYCESCYVATLEKCSTCSEPILDRILRAMGKAYHPGCFTCVVCHRGLDGIPFTVDATSQIHCIEDFHRKFAPRCSVCGGAIMPEPGQEETVRIVALDRSFHIGCYKCEECGLLLSSEGECQGCYPLDGHILCKACSAWRIQELSATVTTDC
ncbi:hypothetical protein A6R68_23775 [Neotoma lepida]|uniref:LIM zinc-binding domain-containing protein n=1 Tax=Neotoma lepida TaxID=56216 RepID=A0A1A6HVG2_NEOLE|nr:hypothetical protein A6R68_23775 [Neotoma lepida]